MNSASVLFDFAILCGHSFATYPAKSIGVGMGDGIAVKTLSFDPTSITKECLKSSCHWA